MNKMCFHLKEKLEKANYKCEQAKGHTEKLSGILVDGQTYTVTFKGRRLKFVKNCCYFFLNYICMLMCLVII